MGKLRIHKKGVKVEGDTEFMKRMYASHIRSTQVINYTHLSFSFTRLFLPNSGRILPKVTEKNKIKNCPQWGLNPGLLDYHANALLNELSQYLVASLNLHGLYKVMLY